MVSYCEYNFKIRDGVMFFWNNLELEVCYKNLAIKIDVDTYKIKQVIHDLVIYSKKVTPMKNILLRNNKKYHRYIFEFFNFLLENHLIIILFPTKNLVKSGYSFMQNLENHYFNEILQNKSETDFTKKLLLGELDVKYIKGWSIEYYHITNNCYYATLPAIARFQGEQKSCAINFCLEEYDHEKLTLSALEALGYSKSSIQDSFPLTYTACYIYLLAKWARFDPISFAASLFVYEGTKDNGDDYIKSLSHYDLPANFSKKHKIHNDINNNGGHGNVSREFLFNDISISTSDERKVRNNFELLNKTEREMHFDLMRFYKDSVLLNAENCVEKTPSFEITNEKLAFEFLYDFHVLGCDFFSCYLSQTRGLRSYKLYERVLVKHLILYKSLNMQDHKYKNWRFKLIETLLMVFSERNFLSCLKLYFEIYIFLSGKVNGNDLSEKNKLLCNHAKRVESIMDLGHLSVDKICYNQLRYYLHTLMKDSIQV